MENIPFRKVKKLCRPHQHRNTTPSLSSFTTWDTKSPSLYFFFSFFLSLVAWFPSMIEPDGVIGNWSTRRMSGTFPPNDPLVAVTHSKEKKRNEYNTHIQKNVFQLISRRDAAVQQVMWQVRRPPLKAKTLHLWVVCISWHVSRTSRYIWIKFRACLDFLT